MHSTSSKQALAVWGFLVIATLATSWLAEHQNITEHWAVPLVMLIAAIKARALILYFMELRLAPLTWRIAFELWAWLLPIIITGFWLLA